MLFFIKQGPKGPQNLKFKTTHRYRTFSLLRPSRMTSLSNSRWQNFKERPTQSTNNRNMVEKAKRDVSESICDVSI